MKSIVTFFGGMVAGLFLAMMLMNHSQGLAVKRGFMEHEQKLYVIVPAKPVAP